MQYEPMHVKVARAKALARALFIIFAIVAIIIPAPVLADDETPTPVVEVAATEVVIVVGEAETETEGTPVPQENDTATPEPPSEETNEVVLTEGEVAQGKVEVGEQTANLEVTIAESDCAEGETVCFPDPEVTEVEIVNVEVGNSAANAIEEAIQVAEEDGFEIEEFNLNIARPDAYEVEVGDYVTITNPETGSTIVGVVTECMLGVYVTVDPIYTVTVDGEIVDQEVVTQWRSYVEVSVPDGETVGLTIEIPGEAPVTISVTGICQECIYVPPTQTETPSLTPSPTPTDTPIVTDTPTFEPTPSLTPSPTVTLPPTNEVVNEIREETPRKPKVIAPAPEVDSCTMPKGIWGIRFNEDTNKWDLHFYPTEGGRVVGEEVVNTFDRPGAFPDTQIVISPDCKLYTTFIDADADRTDIIEWNLDASFSRKVTDTLDETELFPSGDHAVNQLCWSTTGEQRDTVCEDGEMVENGINPAVSPDGSIILTKDEDATWGLIDNENGEVDLPSLIKTPIGWNPDGSGLANIVPAGVALFDFEANRTTAVLDAKWTSFNPEGGYLVSVDANSQLWIHEVSDPTNMVKIEGAEGFEKVTWWTPDLAGFTTDQYEEAVQPETESAPAPEANGCPTNFDVAYSGTSIIDFFALNGQDSSLTNRQEVGTKCGVTTVGTRDGNFDLLEALIAAASE